MTNKELAEKSDLSVSYVGKLLAGLITNPSVQAIQKIAAALNVSIDFLVSGNNSPDNRTANSSEFQLLANYRALNPHGKDRLLELSYVFFDSKICKGQTEEDQHEGET